jgi:GntR family transcriptional regulator
MDHQPIVAPSDVAAIHNSLAPLYHSLGQFIRGRIQSGEWTAGQRIPSERALMQMFGISRATVRQGLDNLVKEGILQRVQGKGTFVAPPKVNQGVLRLGDFSNTMRRSSLRVTGRMQGKEIVIPPLNIQQTLALASGQGAIWLQRLLLVEELPMMIETSYVSAARFPNLLPTYNGAEDLEQFIYQVFGVRIIQENETFEPVILESREAELLGVKSGFPALWVEMLACDELKAPVIYRTSLLRGDRCRFYIDLTFG